MKKILSFFVLASCFSFHVNAVEIDESNMEITNLGKINSIKSGSLSLPQAGGKGKMLVLQPTSEGGSTNFVGQEIRYAFQMSNKRTVEVWARMDQMEVKSLIPSKKKPFSKGNWIKIAEIAQDAWAGASELSIKYAILISGSTTLTCGKMVIKANGSSASVEDSSKPSRIQFKKS